VMVMLPLPRLRYAQLSHDKFRAPKCFPILPQESHPDYSALENGAKLACGLEMLYSEGKPGRGAGASTQADVKSDKNWAAFEQALSSRGFFRGELKGSKEYRRLEEEAQQHFVEGGMGAQEAPAVREQIDALLSMPFSEKDFPASELSADDNESWMEVTPEHLEAMLASRAASGSPGMPTGEEELGAEMQNLFESMSGMVDTVSGHDGARFPHENQEEEDDLPPGHHSEDTAKRSTSGTSASNEVELDMSKFVKTLKNVLGPSEEHNWINDLDDSDESDESDDDDGDDGDEESMEGEASTAGGEGQSMDGDQDEACDTASVAQAMDEELAADLKGGKTLDPVELDMDVVSNLLHSYEAQDGLAGPVSNMLRSMGVHLPDNLDAQEGDEQNEDGLPSAAPGVTDQADSHPGDLMDLD